MWHLQLGEKHYSNLIPTNSLQNGPGLGTISLICQLFPPPPNPQGVREKRLPCTPWGTGGGDSSYFRLGSLYCLFNLLFYVNIGDCNFCNAKRNCQYLVTLFEGMQVSYPTKIRTQYREICKESINPKWKKYSDHNITSVTRWHKRDGNCNPDPCKASWCSIQEGWRVFELIQEGCLTSQTESSLKIKRNSQGLRQKRWSCTGNVHLWIIDQEGGQDGGLLDLTCSES